MCVHVGDGTAIVQLEGSSLAYLPLVTFCCSSLRHHKIITCVLLIKRKCKKTWGSGSRPCSTHS